MAGWFSDSRIEQHKIGLFGAAGYVENNDIRAIPNRKISQFLDRIKYIDRIR